MTRHVYLTRDLAHAREALSTLHMQGIGNEAISLVARSDIELERIPDSMKEADTDAVPAALRGMGVGGASGLLAGLVATVFTPLGVTLAGAAAIGAIGSLRTAIRAMCASTTATSPKAMRRCLPRSRSRTNQRRLPDERTRIPNPARCVSQMQ